MAEPVWIDELRADLQQWQRFQQIGRPIFIGNMGGFTNTAYLDRERRAGSIGQVWQLLSPVGHL
jgi:hypothetical protein